MLKYILPLAAAALLTACTAKPAETPTVVTVPANTSNSVFFKKIKEDPTFSQLKITSRVDIETGKYIPTLDATIYIENGKKVWMNLVAVFFNVGRGIATPQGIQGYEKWNKTYIESDFSYLNRLLNVNFIDYKSLQNLLTGRTFIPVNATDFTFAATSAGYTLTSKNNLELGTAGDFSAYKVTLNYSDLMELNRVLLKKNSSNDELEVTYSNWTNFGEMRLPQNVKIVIKGDKPSQILLENTKFDASPMQTPYSVPANYTKTEIR